MVLSVQVAPASWLETFYALTLATDGADAGEADDRLATPAGALAWRARAAAAQDEERGAEELELLDRRLPAAGFDWYEISNWARPGRACIAATASL